MFKDLKRLYYIQMPDYNKGQIYKIVDVGYNKCYIGSTIQKLSDRMAKHRTNYKAYIEGKRKFDSTAYNIFDEYGVSSCKIEWIEDYPCNSKKELEAREGTHIRNTDCVNRCIAGRTHKQHYHDNKERIAEISRQNYMDNKEEITAKRRQRRKDEPEKIREQEREAYQRNKEKKLTKNKERVECECGANVCFGAKLRHLKSNKHQQYLQSQTNPQE